MGFPPQGAAAVGATAEQVWTYATRNLSQHPVHTYTSSLAGYAEKTGTGVADVVSITGKGILHGVTITRSAGTGQVILQHYRIDGVDRTVAIAFTDSAPGFGPPCAFKTSLVLTAACSADTTIRLSYCYVLFSPKVAKEEVRREPHPDPKGLHVWKVTRLYDEKGELIHEIKECRVKALFERGEYPDFPPETPTRP